MNDAAHFYVMILGRGFALLWSSLRPDPFMQYQTRSTYLQNHPLLTEALQNVCTVGRIPTHGQCPWS